MFQSGSRVNPTPATAAATRASAFLAKNPPETFTLEIPSGPRNSQVLYPEDFRLGPVNPDDFDVFVVKSRVHFRRGFDETGFARTIIIVEAPEPFVA